LNEAARIQAAITARESLKCPRCRHPLQVTMGGDGNEELDLVTCERCEATVMVRLPGRAPGGVALRR
jgi:hypothetical protein